MSWTYDLNASLPPDTGEAASLGATRIRQLKQYISERFTDWVYGLDAADAETDDTLYGVKFIPFNVQTSDPTPVANRGFVYIKDVSAKVELHWIDEDGNVVQLTSAGVLKLPSTVVLITGDQTIAGVKTFSSFPVTPSEAPTTDYQVANKKYVDDQVAGITAVPAGAITMWGGALASPPSGWLTCNGAAVSRTTYADLYTAIGTLYGAGDGSTTFNLPNFTNRFAYGANEGSDAGNASVGSAKDRSLTGNDTNVRLLSGSNNKQDGGGTCTGQNVDMMAPYLAVGFIIKT